LAYLSFKAQIDKQSSSLFARQTKMQITEIGQVIHSRRTALGLSQLRLAKLADLSRATINQLENGTIKDLGIAKLEALLGLIGVRLNAEPIRRPSNGLRMAAITSSVGYRKSFDPSVLSSALQSGKLPKGFEPHIAHLLDEAPLPLIVQVVEDTARGSKVSTKQIWQHLERWAHELQCTRKVWV
jgi:transcriptional regulator with XRE-family HTH domain